MYADPKQVIHYVQLMEARIREILDADGALSLKDLDIDGTELMKELHLKPGPLIGQILDYLLNLVLDDPTLNHKSLLLKQARVVSEYARRNPAAQGIKGSGHQFAAPSLEKVEKITV